MYVASSYSRCLRDKNPETDEYDSCACNWKGRYQMYPVVKYDRWYAEKSLGVLSDSNPLRKLIVRAVVHPLPAGPRAQVGPSTATIFRRVANKRC